ncbi:MAG: hypothetical protein LBH80_00365 [Prevotellaceae bacterium]|jgi:hypothetical protein|nr:hypothetical protein [Prevotellaceae bacterium]
MKYLKNTIYTLILVAALGSCGKKNRFEIDTDKNRINVTVKRFDRDFLTLDVTDLKTGTTNLQEKYPDFYPLFVNNVLNRDTEEVDSITNDLKNYLRDSTFAGVNRDVAAKFGDIAHIEKTLSDAYTRIHHYFPETVLPDIYFFVSGFYRSMLLSPGIIAISADMYLGADYPLYEDVSYRYLIQNMRPESIPVEIISAILFGSFTSRSDQNRLIDRMIFQGKMFYLTAVCMPDEAKENIMGYTKEQWDWCGKYERDIWRAIIDRKDLFSSDTRLIRTYIDDAPFTASVSQDSPGRVGTWIGWRIVESYMNNNTDIDLHDLMSTHDTQKILEDSGYHP